MVPLSGFVLLTLVSTCLSFQHGPFYMLGQHEDLTADAFYALNEQSCIVVVPTMYTELLGTLQHIFIEDPVLFLEDSTVSELSVWPRLPRAKTCLSVKHRPRKHTFTGSVNLQDTDFFINLKCNLSRDLKGHLTVKASKLLLLQNERFRVEEDGQCCESVDVGDMTSDIFLREYVLKSKPVVIKGAFKEQSRDPQLSNAALRNAFGKQLVHVKVAPHGLFEGVESRARWQGAMEIPHHIKEQLMFPDLVVVRPAHREMQLAAFLDRIEKRENTTASFYLEYTSVQDVGAFTNSFNASLAFAGGLRLEHQNMWLSDGNTVGKLHFDPFENLLGMAAGSKTFLVYAPQDSERLYEGHIPEGELTYVEETDHFERTQLQESTAMVMSPFNPAAPDFDRFPESANAKQMACRVDAGDVLYLPAFWWHEVVSAPDKQERRNLAINFWYTPVWSKEFPCATCGLEWNHDAGLSHLI